MNRFTKVRSSSLRSSVQRSDMNCDINKMKAYFRFIGNNKMKGSFCFINLQRGSIRRPSASGLIRKAGTQERISGPDSGEQKGTARFFDVRRNSLFLSSVPVFLI